MISAITMLCNQHSKVDLLTGSSISMCYILIVTRNLRILPNCIPRPKPLCAQSMSQEERRTMEQLKQARGWP